MSVQELEAAVTKLPSPELAQFTAWFEEYQADLWDQQIERDALSGRLDAFAEQANQEFEAGRSHPLVPSLLFKEAWEGGQHMRRWRQAFVVFVLASVVALCGISLYHVILNDQLNMEAKAGNLSAVQTLLLQGADVNGRSIHFKTPLMSAAEGGNGNAVLFLLAHGADVNAHNGSGSVLMWAVASGNVGVVRTLLFRGADVNWRSDAGDTALQMAQEYKQPVIAKMLQSAGARN